jgi:hypothetical protein
MGRKQTVETQLRHHAARRAWATCAAATRSPKLEISKEFAGAFDNAALASI